MNIYKHSFQSTAAEINFDDSSDEIPLYRRKIARKIKSELLKDKGSDKIVHIWDTLISRLHEQIIEL